MKNKLNQTQANILINLNLDGIATELQMIYYSDAAQIPVPNSAYQFKEKAQHLAYELARVTKYPLKDPFTRMIESISGKCDDKTSISVGEHLLMVNHD